MRRNAKNEDKNTNVWRRFCCNSFKEERFVVTPLKEIKLRQHADKMEAM